MKVIINEYGNGIRHWIPREIKKKINMNDFEKNLRTNATLIKYLQNGSYSSNLTIVKVPDNATDWMVIDHDGEGESIVAAVNGKIIHITV